MKAQMTYSCSLDWNSFDINSDSKSRFCQSCKKNVHDITALNQEQIHQLYLDNNKSLCVKATKQQVQTNQNPLWNVIKRVGIACFILLSSFFSQDAIAQVCEQPDYLKITQTATTAETLIIKGKINSIAKHNLQRVKLVEVVIANEEGFPVKTQYVAFNKEFKFNVSKKLLGNTFHVRFSSENHKNRSIEISKIKDTYIQLNMQENNIKLSDIVVGFIAIPPKN